MRVLSKNGQIFLFLWNQQFQFKKKNYALLSPFERFVSLQPKSREVLFVLSGRSRGALLFMFSLIIYKKKE